MQAQEKANVAIGPYTRIFPVIRGIQSGREYYVTMVPLRLVAESFLFDGASLPAELRAQRVLNRARVPEIARYILANPKGYTFSALTASIDRRVNFTPLTEYDREGRVGFISVPIEARFLINDGQHRKAAIEQAIKTNPVLGYETIAVVLYIDAGLRRSQQMFADLNKYAVRPTKSLGVLYDHRDPVSELVRKLIVETPLFKDRIEKERTTISHRSKELFTLSAVYQATRALLGKKKFENVSDEERRLAYEYWNEMAKHIPEWKMLLEGRVTSAELRKEYVHSHGVVLHALGTAGNSLVSRYPDDWKNHLTKLEEIDWTRENSEWEGRSMSGGRLSKSFVNVILTTNYLKKTLGLPLSSEEQRIEQGHLRGQA
jgi:DNA sulfur modification protein DndB